MISKSRRNLTFYSLTITENFKLMSGYIYFVADKNDQ